MVPRPPPKRKHGQGKLYLLGGFFLVVVLFIAHNSAYLTKQWGREQRARAARLQLESTTWQDSLGYLANSLDAGRQLVESGEEDADELAEREQLGAAVQRRGRLGALAGGGAWEQHQRGLEPNGYSVQRPRVFAIAAQPTLVLYVYYGSDFEHEERLAYFIGAAINEGDGATYKIILAHPGIEQAALPPLPFNNAEYVRPEQQGGCNDTWGAIGGTLPNLGNLDKYEFLVVVDSNVMGPFLPPYITPVLHWTEVLTRKLGPDTKLVGSFISCEGVPHGGSVAADWRLNPYVLPHAWATDKAGLALLRGDASILQCHEGYWDARYYGDSGAALAMLQAGHNLDSLMLRYQGVDWRQKKNWECNARVRPDGVGLYDGVMPSPFEVMFLPLSMAEAQHRLMLRTASRYAEWIVPEGGAVNVTRNAYNFEEYEGDWAVRGRKVLLLQKRWSCFDEEYYVKHNPDLRDLPDNNSDAISLWDHFLTYGQFQGRMHRFVCGEPKLSKEDSVKLMLQRGRACFDHNAYRQAWTDLAALQTPQALWLHYVQHGQFEGRGAKFVCPETLKRLVTGLDGTSIAQQDAEMQAQLRPFIKGGQQQQ